ncbi:MAG: AI-2E family transporter [Corynebacterium sp.]|nr:AI-2E family transporter [Corynebacterium sp.]
MGIEKKPTADTTPPGDIAGHMDALFDVPAEQTADRAAIIGRDGKWLAAWAARFIIIAIAAYILWLAINKVSSGALPIALALLLATVLWPPVRWLRNHGVPASLSVVVVLLAGIGIIVGLIAAMAPSVSNQSGDLINRSVAGAHTLMNWVQGPPLNLQAESINKGVNEILTKIQSQATDIASGVVSGVSTASEVIISFFIMIILTFFFLKDGPRFLPWMRKMTGPTVGWHLSEVLLRIWNSLSGYIRAQAAVSLIDSICIGIGLFIMKVPLAMVLIVLTFFAGFIPIVGAISAGAVAVLIALVSNGWATAIGVLILIVAVQQLEGHILSPLFQSKAMDLHPAIVLLSVTVGGTLYGIPGAFLAVPVAATIAVVLRYHSELVSLRSGELEVKDLVIATGEDRKHPDEKTNSQDPNNPVVSLLNSIGKVTRKNK